MSEDLVLQDIERLKAIAPIMKRFKIEPDGWFKTQTEHEWDNDYCIFLCEESPGKKIPTWRADKLDSVLPDWYSYPDSGTLSIQDLYIGVTRKYHDELTKVLLSRGQAKLEATADLLVLLKANGIRRESL